MVQPYLPAVDERGETALVFVAGELSHVLRKRAVLAPDEVAPPATTRSAPPRIMYDEDLVRAGDGRRRRARAGRTAIVAAVAERFGEPPLYARVDLLAGEDGCAHAARARARGTRALSRRGTRRGAAFRGCHHLGLTMHLAQLNVALGKAAVDAPEMAEFVANLDRSDALGDSAPGFVWRLQDEDGNATSIHPYDDERMIINLSVWESIEALWSFVYDGGHLEIMRRRREWFQRRSTAYVVLWWVPEGRIPTVEEAMARLDHLQAHGPTAEAFTFKHRFDEVVDVRA